MSEQAEKSAQHERTDDHGCGNPDLYNPWERELAFEHSRLDHMPMSTSGEAGAIGVSDE
ncbi:hypothetical protein [Mesorhizobium sp. SP-1A]|uniref:hypothetical protein n=1 Tax=Mesorhizobium sp. SP-1A TaxID=3077840 RepID=UPI0028F6F301|nr:hypothetical protein [Mesorhizobium sp. SP-1A]